MTLATAPATCSGAVVYFVATRDLADKPIYPSPWPPIRHEALDLPVIGIARSAHDVDELRAQGRESLPSPFLYWSTRRRSSVRGGWLGNDRRCTHNGRRRRLARSGADQRTHGVLNNADRSHVAAGVPSIMIATGICDGNL